MTQECIYCPCLGEDEGRRPVSQERSTRLSYLPRETPVNLERV